MHLRSHVDSLEDSIETQENSTNPSGNASEESLQVQNTGSECEKDTSSTSDGTNHSLQDEKDSSSDGTASLEVQNILMGANNDLSLDSRIRIVHGSSDEDIPGTSSEGQNVLMEHAEVLQTSVSHIESTFANYYESSDTETDSTMSTSETDSVDSSSEFCPTPLKKTRVETTSPIELGNSMFLCQTTQLQQFVNQINETALCYTPKCTGRLFPISVKSVGLGGCVVVKFSCSGCAERMIDLTSSTVVGFSHRITCSLAAQVAFIASGCMHSQYSKVLKQGLGMSAVSSTTFYETIKMLQPIVNTMVDEMCELAKSEMKALDPATVGSWQRAITTSDGAWLTRGKYSQNCTFTIRNYVNNSLLYFVHLCMRGKGNEQHKLYEGTAKGAEGHAADIAFGHAKEDGMVIEVQWQDGDSSSAKAFRMHYPDAQKSKVMLCGGHVARAHTKHLSEVAKQKAFSETMKDALKGKYPDVTTVKCHCPKRHKKNCGCFSKSFLRGARTNFFYCLLQAETDPQIFATRLLVLGKYHARDIHSWDGGGHCDFHELKGEGEDEDYHSKNPLTCPFHALAYEVECANRASQAPQIIHTELGRGHSNYPEASHNVLVRFRSKDKYLHSIHYMLSTNMGLMQANMTWLNKKHGMSYHWLLELFRRLKLPVFDGMIEALTRGNEIRAQNLERKQTEQAKENRTNWKKARVQEQEERKQWIRRQKVLHTYGSDDDDEDSNEDNDENDCDVGNARKQRKCKCGSFTHRLTTHRNCPLNKKRLVTFASTAASEDESTASDVEMMCTCGSERGTHSRSCPLNPRNRTQQ